MKKILLTLLGLLPSLSLYGADNDLYDNSIALNIGYGITTADQSTFSGGSYGLQINRNLNTSDGALSVDALQFTVDYAHLNSSARDYALRVGTNAMWYVENYTDWTPFVKMGLGAQYVAGEESVDPGDYVFGTLGAGMELQLRGDTSIVGEYTDHITTVGENNSRVAVGMKYSFGQSY